MKLEFTEKDILEAAVAEIIGEAELRQSLAAGRPLKVKLGIDPTSPNIHLGRSISLWRLRAFQELGHEVHLIVGDFTGQVGDTSDKEAERPMLSREEIQANLARYEEQLWMVLNPERKDQVHIHYNSSWLEGLTLASLSWMADAFSVNAFIKRELIARRLEAGSRVSLRELLYPIMQGYDSVMVGADVELGGTDQRFNLLAGRVLQEQAGQPPQSVITTTLISGTDGRKMSSSWGNVISLLDAPQDKFGKLMALQDGLMSEYLSVLPLSARPFTAEELAKRLQDGQNPRDAKLELAWSLVALYHGDEEADQARQQWVAQFSESQKPADIPERSLAELTGDGTLPGLLVEAGLALSKSEARRLIQQRAVRLNDQVVEQADGSFPVEPGTLIQVGKRHYLRLIP